MTYLTGLAANIIIWVAPDFRQEHLSAIRWLNENTLASYSFFAVRLRVVQIGDSPFAPLFEILERPNDWDRQVQQIATEAQASRPGTPLKRAFWARYLELFPDAANDIAIGWSTRWRALPELQLVLSQWRSEISVGVFVRGIRGTDNSAIKDRLASDVAELESRLGTVLENPLGLLATRWLTPLTDESQRDEAARWLHAATERYVSVLREVLGEAN